MHRRHLLAGAAALPLVRILPGRAQGQVSDGVVKIGVLNDMTGVFSDQQGMGEVVAARLAIEEMGGRVLGAPVELIHGDLLNRPDVGMGIARRWFDQEKVDIITGIGNSAVALAVQTLSKEKQRIVIPMSAGTTDLTGKDCGPWTAHWVYDNYSAAKGPVTALVRDGRRRWFFVTSDYAFGHSLEANASAILKSLGGEVAGSVRVPLGETDYSSYLVRAAASGAQAVGICAGGADMINIAKQMGEFGLIKRGIVPAALNCSLTNIRSIGLETGQGMVYAESYYWDQNDGTRAFAERFRRLHGKMPTAFQAGSYGAVLHYLKAVQAAGTDATPAVMAKMRELPVNDMMTVNGSLRQDGRVVRDVHLMRVKAPAQSKGEWDLLEVAGSIPGAEAFRPMDQGGCPLVKA
ncbi:ABC transporter substrate-binding protein [Paracraurococcus ruber]|uniref:ABC transporter permease n=1 Tax=Paracraurococcus ruber TaxID=77675 RepID=A0ABS1D0D7_9PROT|nr:ABC transporter substrate-binding protein [Paracraurococcus ruber]MBK1660174.1 ABC transporter permease [Paracraurococcus ruber]TDG28868.1 ABC transporter substrate-binding protein [Paracraurococcus ruber]